jgi:hypothetical protein
MANIRTMENLDLPVQKFDLTNLSLKYPYIDQAEVVGLNGVRQILLIGQDNCDLIVAKEVIHVNPDAPAISKTRPLSAGRKLYDLGEFWRNYNIN